MLFFLHNETVFVTQFYRFTSSPVMNDVCAEKNLVGFGLFFGFVGSK